MQFSIVIPTYNHLEDCLKPCLESLIKYTNFDNIEVVVVANGCTDDTKKYVEGLGSPFKLIWIDEAIGYTEATNIGILESKGHYIILLNNDVVLLEQPKNTWLEMLYIPFTTDESVGMTGPMLVRDIDTRRNFIIFFCAMIKRSMFSKLGTLDEVFSPGFGEDVDFGIKVQNAGYKLIQVPSVSTEYYKQNYMTGGFPIYHKGEETIKHIPEMKEVLIRNKQILKAKYNPPVVRLNLGCGDVLESEYMNVDLYNPQAEIKADAGALPFPEEFADEIKAIHMFEHISPYEVNALLTHWYGILKPGGKLILEMPDIKTICKNFEAEDKNGRYRLLNVIYGTTQIAHPHLFGWYDEILVDRLKEVGFKDIKIMEPQYYHWGYNFRAEATK